MKRDVATVEVHSRVEWRQWLEQNHQQVASIDVITFRRASGDPRYVRYEELVEEALCFGWIDSTRRTLDEQRTIQLFTPRKRGSAWSLVNKERIEHLVAAGLMTPAGQARIDEAKADGSWSRYDDADNLVVPADLAAALDRIPNARTNFEAFPPSSRKRILAWIAQAKRPETRARRIGEAARLAGLNERANHPKPGRADGS